MAKLQKELARVKQENEILKKAVAIFTNRTNRPQLDTNLSSNTGGGFLWRRFAG